MKNWMLVSVLLVGLTAVGRSESIALQNPSFESPVVSVKTYLSGGSLPGWEEGNWSYLEVRPNGQDGVNGTDGNQYIYLNNGWLMKTYSGIGQPNTTYFLRVDGRGFTDTTKVNLGFKYNGTWFEEYRPLTNGTWTTTQSLVWTSPATMPANSDLSILVQAIGVDMFIDNVRLDVARPVTLQNPSFEAPVVSVITSVAPGTLPGWEEGNWGYLDVRPSGGTDGNQYIYMSGGWLSKTYPAIGQPNTTYVLLADGRGFTDTTKVNLGFKWGGNPWFEEYRPLTNGTWTTQSLVWTSPATMPVNSDLTILVQAVGIDMHIDNIRLNATLGQFTAAPVFTPGGKYISGPKDIKITATPGATIYYTTDGSTPTVGGTPYTGEVIVTVTEGMTLKAIAEVDGFYPSFVTSQTFVVPAYDNPATIPAGSATVDGDLSDWVGADWTALNINYDGSATDVLDASFTARWSEDRVYVAVKVRDTAHKFADIYTDWAARDGMEVYLHTTGNGPDHFPFCETAQQYTFGFNAAGTSVWAALGNSSMYSSTNPVYLPTMFIVPADADYCTSAGQINGEWLYYEVSVKPFDFLGVVKGGASVASPLALADVIRLDVVVVANNGSTSAGTWNVPGYTGMKSANNKIGKSGSLDKFGLHKLGAADPVIPVTPVNPSCNGPMVIDPVVYYSFDNAANVGADGSGHGYHAIVGQYPVNSDPDNVISGVVFGYFGGAVNFPKPAAKPDYTYAYHNALTLPAINAADIPTSGFTVAAWVNLDASSMGEHYQLFAAEAGDGKQVVSAQIRIPGDNAQDNVYRLIVSGVGGTTIKDLYLGPITRDQWVHYVGTYDQAANRISIYINGQLLVSDVADTTNLTLADNWNNGAKIGTTMSWGRQLVGLMDEFYLFKRALTPVEVKILSGAQVLAGDANGDGMVDVGDLGILAANYGGSGKTWPLGDFNKDGLVDVGDLGILAAHYGQGSGQASNFSEDYAKAFGTTATADDTEDETVGNSMCSALGLPLIAALALMGLMLVKLED
jgi:hypothetical protein